MEGEGFDEKGDVRKESSIGCHCQPRDAILDEMYCIPSVFFNDKKSDSSRICFRLLCSSQNLYLSIDLIDPFLESNR